MQVASRNGNVSRKSGLSHSLSMYSAPPSEELTIDEFEVMSLDRLQLLRGLELLKTRGYEGKEMMEKIKQVRRTIFPLFSDLTSSLYSTYPLTP